MQQKKRMTAIGIIPVRYDSTRFKGKALADLLGKPMIQHVWEKARKAATLDDLIIAADDEIIIDAVKSFGGKAILTSNLHPSGTDRVHEAVQGSDADIVINIQSDEPMLAPSMIDDLVVALSEDNNIYMASLRKKINNMEQIGDPNTVKVVVDSNDYALYFSRAPIPFNRNARTGVLYYKHIGLYAFTRKFLSVFAGLPVSSLEALEKLEQLRALQNGYKIKVLEAQHETVSVDTPEDLENVKIKLSGVEK